MVDRNNCSHRIAVSSGVPSADPIEPAADAGSKRVAPTEGPALACRPMGAQDIEPAILLLSSGFPERSPDYWRRALQRLRDRHIPQDQPRYGHVMTNRGRLVGIVLVIYSTTDTGTIRGNVSSWYVEPAYRGFANLLLAAPLRKADVVLQNVSPAPSTLDTIRAQGFAKYVGGTFQALAALAPPVTGVAIRRIAADTTEADAILTDHAGWDCLSFELSHGGTVYPFVFARSRFVSDRFSCAELVYSRSVEDFVRFAGPLGRRLLRHGFPAVMIDAEGPLAGLIGSYRPGRGLRFSRGATAPRVGDLSYTELAIFGP